MAKNNNLHAAKTAKNDEFYTRFDDINFEINLAEHIIPWSKGGKTEYGNLQILCVKCNCKKSAEQEAANTREFSIKQ